MAEKDTKALEKEKVRGSGKTFAAAFLTELGRRKKRKRKPTDPAAPGGLGSAGKLYE